MTGIPNWFGDYLKALERLGLTPEAIQSRPEQLRFLAHDVKNALRLPPPHIDVLYVEVPSDFPFQKEDELHVINKMFGRKAKVALYQLENKEGFEALRTEICQQRPYVVRIPAQEIVMAMLNDSVARQNKEPLPPTRVLYPLWKGTRGGGGEAYYSFVGFHVYTINQTDFTGYDEWECSREHQWPPRR